MTTAPTVCRDYRISVDSNLDVRSCTLDAPPHFAKWAEEHPGWRITRWHCTNKSEDAI
jgi:hypothetical protein